jgi:hypothetical protein
MSSQVVKKYSRKPMARVVETRLLRDPFRPTIYLTLDFWNSRQGYEEFMASHKQEYKELDKLAGKLTSKERRIGWYEMVECWWEGRDRKTVSRSEEISIKGNVFHGVMLSIAGPKLEVVERDSSRYQRVSEFHMVALGILSEIFASADANPRIDGDALDRSKERVERWVLVGTCPVPEFRNSHRRTE